MREYSLLAVAVPMQPISFLKNRAPLETMSLNLAKIIFQLETNGLKMNEIFTKINLVVISNINMARKMKNNTWHEFRRLTL